MERHEKPSKISGHEKTLKPLRFQGFLMISTRDQRFAESPYLFGDRQALPKTPEKTEMVLRFPLGFA